MTNRHVTYHDHTALQRAYEDAAAWAEYGYTQSSRDYWRGMRDTLAVLLGHTTVRPGTTGEGTDAAATTMLPDCRPILR